jgi:thiaminase/transcriptional activator TenA
MDVLSERLRAAADPIFRAQLEHPFVQGIGDGTLGPDRFRYYLKQDYLFLIEYARTLALACARAPRVQIRQEQSGLGIGIVPPVPRNSTREAIAQRYSAA